MIFNFDIDSAYYDFVKSSKQNSLGKTAPVLPTQMQLVEAGIKYLSAPIVLVDEEQPPILARAFAFARPEDVDWSKFEMLYQVRHDRLTDGTQNYIVRGVAR